mgnify:CR=1 FL=1
MNILFVISGETEFKKRDEKLFSELGSIRKINLVTFNDYLNNRIFSNYIWSDIIIIWFASFHALPFFLLNQLFNKKIFIIAGGYDVTNYPEIGYGSMRYGYRRTIGKWILKHTQRIIAVSNSNRKEIIQNCNVQPERIKLIYNAIELKKNQKVFQKKNQVLTVGEINEETILRKGLDRFLLVSKAFPDIQFIHIGKWTDKHGKLSDIAFKKLKTISSGNVKFLGFVSEDILKKTFQESKIYLQLSRHEAFGVSVLESMKYGCVPIVTNAYALPEVVGENGFIIESQKECISAIKATLENQYNQQNQINPLFDISKRKAAFERLINC